MLKRVYFLLDEESQRALEKLPEGHRSMFIRCCLKKLLAGEIRWVPSEPEVIVGHKPKEEVEK